MVNIKLAIWMIGIILIIFSVFFLVPMTWAIIYEPQEIWTFVYSILSVVGIGTVMSRFKPEKVSFGKRDGFLIVSVGWLALCFAGSMPYVFGEVTSNYTNAFFESTSGLTTTGASIFNDIEALPESILLWRSLTQWIGGMGIIVLTIAVLPMLGVSGVELFVAEVPGPKSEKIHPQIKETAKRLWLLYLGLTFSLVLVLYFISHLSFFDALNHAFTTISTGGFSTKNDSMAHFNTPIVQYPIILFMFLAGMNYTILYYGLGGKFRRVWSSDEFKTYIAVVFVFVTITVISVFTNTDQSFEQSFRDGALQVISIVTTTGFVSADYTSWNTGMTLFFFFLLFTGACAGSTSGGIKVIRHLAFAKNTFLEFKRLLHPRAVIRMKIDNVLVAPKILTHILVFLLVYLSLFIFGTIIMSVILADSDNTLITAFGSVATSLGNVGPGIGGVGPTDNFAQIPKVGKYILSALMIIGRLELFTVLIIFTPYFWKTN